MQRAVQKEEQNEQSMLFYRVSWFCELINKGPGRMIMVRSTAKSTPLTVLIRMTGIYFPILGRELSFQSSALFNYCVSFQALADFSIHEPGCFF
jgi:hypothetical protein